MAKHKLGNLILKSFRRSSRIHWIRKRYTIGNRNELGVSCGDWWGFNCYAAAALQDSCRHWRYIVSDYIEAGSSWRWIGEHVVGYRCVEIRRIWESVLGSLDDGDIGILCSYLSRGVDACEYPAQLGVIASVSNLKTPAFKPCYSSVWYFDNFMREFPCANFHPVVFSWWNCKSHGTQICRVNRQTAHCDNVPTAITCSTTSRPAGSASIVGCKSYRMKGVCVSRCTFKICLIKYWEIHCDCLFHPKVCKWVAKTSCPSWSWYLWNWAWIVIPLNYRQSCCDAVPIKSVYIWGNNVGRSLKKIALPCCLSTAGAKCNCEVCRTGTPSPA